MGALFICVVARAHKGSYLAHLLSPPALRGPKHFFFKFYFFCGLLGGSILGCVPVDGLLHTLALTKRLDKQANIARARNVELYFRLFRYVNPCVNACWSM